MVREGGKGKGLRWNLNFFEFLRCYGKKIEERNYGKCVGKGNPTKHKALSEVRGGDSNNWETVCKICLSQQYKKSP